MRLKLTAVLLVTVGLMGLVGLAGCGSLPGDAAVEVNDKIITKDDVTERIEKLRRAYSTMIPAEDDGDIFANFRRDVADQLVREELELQETEKRGITVSEAEVDARMQEIADDKFLGEISSMIQEFEAKGLTLEDMREDIRRTMLHEKLEADIGKDIQVTEQDALDYYERNKAQYVQPERRQVRQIITADEAVAADAVKRAQAGEDFLVLVSDLSIDENADAKKGALGFVVPGQLAPELDQAVFGLDTGNISNPVKLGEQWYVLRVESIVPPVNKSFEDVKQEIMALYGGQIYSQRWRDFVDEVYRNAAIEFDEEYDPQFKVDITSTVPVE